MDCCCYNRPFDDQNDPIIYLESEAIKVILSLCEKGVYTLVISDVLIFEVEKTPDILRRERLKAILENIEKQIIGVDSTLEERAKCFEKLGLGAFDALHLACAEKGADILLTVDRKFLKKSSNIADLQIKVVSPLEWLKGLYYGKIDQL